MRLRFRIICYVVAWLGALFATNPSGKYWPLAYMFPLGLVAFLSRYWGNTGGWGVFLGCIAVYVGVLAILLTCNVSGCRAMLNTH